MHDVFKSSFRTGILHGAGLWQLPKQLYLPTEEKSAQAPNSHLKYVWYGSPCRSGTCVLAFAFLGLSPGSASLSLCLRSLIIFAVLFKKNLTALIFLCLERSLTLILHMVASLPFLVLIKPC